MFGRAKPKLPGAIDLGDAQALIAGSAEAMRLWNGPGGPTIFIDTGPLGPNPFALGLAMVDCIRHGAKAYAQAHGMTEGEALKLIWAGVDAEREFPTDTPISLTHDGETH